jgi:hypothetical protein
MVDPRKHAIVVENGKVKFVDRYSFDREIKDYEGRKAWLTIGGRRNSRTLNQNAYYWGVVVTRLAGYLGYFPDEIHEVLKQKFLPAKSIALKNEEVVIPQSTSTLDTIQFEEYLEQIRIWAVRDLEFTLPLPNEDI